MGEKYEQMLLPDCALVPYLAPYLKSGYLRDSLEDRRSYSPQSSSDVSFSGTRLLSQL